MAKDAAYTVLVRDLPCHRTFDIAGPLVGDWLRGRPLRDALGAPELDAQAGGGHAELDLYADGTHAFAAGTFDGHVVVGCSRCLSAMRLDIHQPLHVTFMPPGEMPAEDDAPTTDDGPAGAEDDRYRLPFH